MKKCLFELLVVNMDDNIREQVHYNFAPCTDETFLNEYLKLDQEFIEFALEILGADTLYEMGVSI